MLTASRRRALLLAAVACLAPRAAAEESPAGKPIPYDGWMGVLPTGMRLLVIQRPGIDRVAVGISWLAGSVDDPPGKEGLAHVVEHLTFRARTGPSTVWGQLQADGVAFNAFTEHDATVYFEVGKPDQLPLMLAVEGDRMRNPLAGVTEDDVATEKAIVTSELREAEQFQPWYRGAELLEARLFPEGHPYHRSIGGTAETVGRIGFEDVKAFVKAGYTADRAIMVIVAPGPVRQTSEAAIASLGTFATGDGVKAPSLGKPEPVTRPPPPLPPPPPTELVEVAAPVERPVLLLGFAVPGEAAEQVPVAQAAAGMLRSSVASRLFMGDLEDQVAGIWSEVVPRDGAAEIVLIIQLEEGADAGRVLQAARDHLVKMTEDRRAARFAKDWRERLLTDAYLDVERFDVVSLARSVRATGKPDAIRARQFQILQLNRSLDGYAYQHLQRGRSAAVLVRPDPADAARLVLGASTGLADRLPERHEQRNQPFVPRRPVAQVARPPGLDQAVRRLLPNGLEVVVAPRGALPFAEVRLVMRTDPAGGTELPAVLPEVALSLHGSSADRRWMHGHRIGLQSWLDLEPDYLTYGVRGSSLNLDEILSDAARWPRSFTVSRTGVQLVKEAMQRSLRAAARNPEQRGLEALRRALYPDHPYGRTPDAAELEAISVRDVERWADTQLRPDRATLLIAGDVEPEAALAKATSAFKGWSAPAAPPRAVQPPASPAAQRVILVDRPGAKLALVLVGLRLPGGPGRDDPAAAALAWRLDSSLMETLRVDAGVTYGVRVVPLAQAQARSLVVQTAVDAPVAADALGRVLGAVEVVAQVSLPPEALDRARWQVARQHARSFDTVALASRALERMAVEGLPADHFERQAGSIAALTPARLQALAKGLVGTEVAVVVGDAAVLAPLLKDAGFDPERAGP